MTLAALDVDYRDDGAVAACVCFAGWGASASSAEHVATIVTVSPYLPGELYRRELPCLLAVLEKVPVLPEVLIVDGYVTLGGETPGLGMHLFTVLERRTIVVGVAKTRYQKATDAVAIRRGSSRAPLFVTAAGMDAHQAAEHVRAMHGPHRLPTMIARADALARTV